MSATIESDLFANYYEMPFNDEMLIPAPVLRVAGRAFEVQQFFTDDFKELGDVSLKIIIFLSFSIFVL